jgi:hypothetical protein
MEPDNSSPYSQELTNGPCPEPHKSSPKCPILYSGPKFFINKENCDDQLRKVSKGYNGFQQQTLHEKHALHP